MPAGSRFDSVLLHRRQPSFIVCLNATALAANRTGVPDPPVPHSGAPRSTPPRRPDTPAVGAARSGSPPRPATASQRLAPAPRGWPVAGQVDCSSEVGQVGRVGKVAPHQQGVVSAGGADPRPRVVPFALGARPGAAVVPPRLFDQPGGLVGAHRGAAAKCDRKRARYPEHVADLPGFAPATKGRVLPGSGGPLARCPWWAGPFQRPPVRTGRAVG
jgi:hypothetical protein